jgi:hypothetical protein
MLRKLPRAFIVLVVIGLTAGIASAAPGVDVRVTNDDGTNGGYISDYTMVTGTPYTDNVLTACSSSHGRQNEPAVAVDPRNPDVIVGSSNDYCGVFNQNGTFVNDFGPVWMGYYRTENGTAASPTWVSSLIPGYPGDTSPYAANAHVRTGGAGDPVLAWDSDGRLFAGSESSSDPSGSAKTFGDEWVATYQNPDGANGNTANDGKKFIRSVTVAKGTSAPNLLGKFNDKTAIEVDRTGGDCDGNVYFAWSRFTGNVPNGFNSSVYVVRSTDHGRTWSSPMKISQTVHDIQGPDISVTGDGDVYITYREFADVRSNQKSDGIAFNRSTNCGATFGQPHRILSFEPYDPTDISSVDGSVAGDCGDAASACESGYTFMRGGTLPRSTADQGDANNDYIYIVYDPSIPGTEVPTGTTYGSVVSADLPAKYHKNIGSLSGIYFFRLNGDTGAHTGPTLIDDPRTHGGGLQRFADISADGGSLHTIWWDDRNDPCKDPRVPLGDCFGSSMTSTGLDAFGATAQENNLGSWTVSQLSDQSSNPNWEQFSGRTLPFGGDYLYVSSVGSFSYGLWTDYRDVVAGSDPREGGDNDADGADVKQCRTQNPDGSFSADTCPWDGGLDQNIYGDQTP